MQLEENPGTLEGNRFLVDIFIISKSLLMKMLTDNFDNGAEDLLQDVIIKGQEKYSICAFPVKGFFSVVDSIKSYFRVNMELLKPAIRQSLFSDPGPIFTKVKDEPPAKYVIGSDVKNSLLSNGCLVEGRVENSILFRGVKIKKGAIVKNSIIMPKGEIEEGARVEYAVLDKKVKVSKGKEVIGGETSIVIVGRRKKL
jgi:glucose-1-phosphate adenylyltransferase